MPAPAAAGLLLTATACAAQPGISDLFEQVRPAVVVIHTVERSAPTQKVPGEVATGGLGSGVLISDDGLVLTASHVVHLADQVQVEFFNGEKIYAEIIGSAPLSRLSWPLESPSTGNLCNRTSTTIGAMIGLRGFSIFDASCEANKPSVMIISTSRSAS